MSSARLGRPTARNIGVGLPATPRARSVGRYDAREMERERHREWARESDYMPQRRAPVPPDTPPTRLRTVRSVASMITPSSSSSSRRGGSSSSYRKTDVPDVPPVPAHLRRKDVSHKSSDSSGSSASYLSSASASGSSSGFLGRMKGRGRGYVSSSRTSLEDDEPEPRKEMGYAERDGWGSRQRTATAALPEYEYDYHDQTRVGRDGEVLPAQLGYGYGLSLWSRVATAASTLTLNVSKAWASNIAVYSGELTPPGEESRLTRAMKAYHIDKARDPADLPAWLFEEHERPTRPSRHAPPVPGRRRVRRPGIPSRHCTAASQRSWPTRRVRCGSCRNINIITTAAATTRDAGVGSRLGSPATG